MKHILHILTLAIALSINPSPSQGAGGSLVCTAFVSDMPSAYAAADLVISRAGASSISEICLLGKPAILVPSPNVAEDHQTHNAMALVRRDAAVLVKDVDAANIISSPEQGRSGGVSVLVDEALRLLADPDRLETLSANVEKLAQHDSARRIAEEVMKLARRQ